MKNKFKFIAAICSAFVYLFVLSSINANGFNLKVKSDSGNQTISVAHSSQLFSHFAEKNNAFNEFSQSNNGLKYNSNLASWGVVSIEIFFKHQFCLFVKQASNVQLSFQRKVRLFPFHYFL